MSKWRSNNSGRTVVLFEKDVLTKRIEDTAVLLVKGAAPDTITKEQGALMSDIFQDNGNRDFASQCRDTAFEELKSMLAPLTRTPVFPGCSAGEGTYKGPEYISLNLFLPKGFSTTTVDMLTEAGEDYLVYSTLYHWASIVASGLLPTIEKLLTAADAKLRGYLNVRTHLIKRNTSIF